MGEITRQARGELRQLPLMLGKLAGGIAAVVGFTAAVLIVSRRPGWSAGDILPSLLLGGAGVVLFVLSGRALARRSASQGEGGAPPAAGGRTSLLSWVLLLLLSGIFLAFVWFMTR
uniref:Uncharacterized protein n=1 Tax=Geobacter metallireducens TaxID=28232 RepID=A0A831UJ28_GEOME